MLAKRVFVCHGQEKNTWNSKSTNSFTFKQAGTLHGPAPPLYSNCHIPRLPSLSPLRFHSLFYLQPAQNMGFSPSRPPAACFLSNDLGFPECCPVNEMWDCHMYLDKIYQWMN